MIITNNVYKMYGKLQVLKDVSISCNKNSCVAFIGPNGSGKTTFIKCLLGIVVPDSGFISVQGINIQNTCTYKQHIGYMPQMPSFPQHLQVGQLIDMMKDLRTDINSYDEDLLKAFQLSKLFDKRLGTLSGGTRQKVSAVIAFLFKSAVLILDEPSAGLDPLSAEILKEKVQATYQSGRLVLITSHILSELDEMVNEVVYIQDGELQFHKPLLQIKEETGEQRLGKAISKYASRKII